MIQSTYMDKEDLKGSLATRWSFEKILVILSLVIGGIGLFLAGYFYAKVKEENQELVKQPAKKSEKEILLSPTPIVTDTPTPTKVTIPTNVPTPTKLFAEWQTYKNIKYSYEFKYPRDKAGVKDNYEGAYVIIELYPNTPKASEIIVFAKENKEGLSELEFFARDVNSVLEEIRPHINVQEVSFGNAKAVRVVKDKDFFKYSSLPYTSYLISRNGIMYTIVTSEYYGKSNGEKTIIYPSAGDYSLHRKILSTFRFF